MTYRRRASPLHAARAAAAMAWCLALGLAALVQPSPIILGSLLASVLGAAALAGVGAEVRRALRLALPLALAVMVVNALVTRDGLTVIWRFGDLPILGDTNVTLEATVYGLVLGLRAAVLVLCGVLYSLCVDPDEVLRLLRRRSFRSALTATVATRMVPVLLRDARRLAEAQRCRPGRPPGRLALMRATTSSALDRALDVAAVLEVRGFASAARQPVRGGIRGAGRSWGRHDLAFAGSAVGILAVSVAGRATRLASFAAYPSLHMAAGLGVWVVAFSLLALALVPFADRRGVEG